MISHCRIAVSRMIVANISITYVINGQQPLLFKISYIFSIYFQNDLSLLFSIYLFLYIYISLPIILKESSS